MSEDARDNEYEEWAIIGADEEEEGCQLREEERAPPAAIAAEVHEVKSDGVVEPS